jgi:hypothetical protein
MFFLIAGVRPRVRTSSRNRVGRCGQCGSDQVFEAVRIRPYLEIFFVPLFPLGEGERAWRCTSCQTLRADVTPKAPARGKSVGRVVPFPQRASKLEPTSGFDLEAAERRAAGEPGGSTRESSRESSRESPRDSTLETALESTLGTRQSVAPRYCHHCGSKIEGAPSEGRAPGFRRYHCGSCGRDFEVGA